MDIYDSLTSEEIEDRIRDLEDEIDTMYSVLHDRGQCPECGAADAGASS